jgi:hypothetical protein
MANKTQFFIVDDNFSLRATAAKPPVDNAAITILIQPSPDPVTPYVYHVHEPTMSEYRNRQTLATITGQFRALSAADGALVESCINDYSVFCAVPDDIPTALNLWSVHMSTLIPDDVDTPNLEGFADNVANGKVENIYRWDNDAFKLVNPPPRTLGQILSNPRREDLVQLIEIVDPAVKYLGFHPKTTRRVFLQKRADPAENAKDLLLIFTSYAHIGNNIAKLNRRRVDVDISSQVRDAVEDLNIVKVERTKEALTLPRLAIAFMPEYLLYRKFVTTDLQDQTDSTINVSYKDIAFAGCDLIRSMTGYEEFHKEFSSYIHNKGKGVEITDAAFLKSWSKWLKVAINGYRSDKEIHTAMSSAVSASGVTRKAAIDMITDSMVNHRTTLNV